jgi:hypothetical protein
MSSRLVAVIIVLVLLVGGGFLWGGGEEILADWNSCPVAFLNTTGREIKVAGLIDGQSKSVLKHAAFIPAGQSGEVRITGADCATLGPLHVVAEDWPPTISDKGVVDMGNMYTFDIGRNAQGYTIGAEQMAPANIYKQAQ